MDIFKRLIKKTAKTAKKPKKVNSLNNERKNYILNLLEKARELDSNFEQFGSQKHKYRINPVILPEQVRKVEEDYGFKLPDDYFWFITNVGNGGAGPYYGLEPFKIDNKEYLISVGKQTVLSPKNSQEEYDHFIKKYEECDDEDYDRLYDELWQGLLYLGTQGCTLNMNIVMSGEHKGKVIYGDYDGFRPFFPYTESFLEWYECWLEETIAGYDMTWYGGKIPGDEKNLLEKYILAKDDVELRTRIVFSMMKFKKVSSETLEQLYHYYTNANDENEKEELFKRLIKFKHPKINQIILEGLHSDNPDKYMEYIIGYQKDNFNYWYRAVLENMNRFSKKCLDNLFWRFFQSCSNVKVEDMLMLFNNKSVHVRAAALGNLFRFCDTKKYIENILPMFDDEKSVAIQAIYMTHESNDKRLIPIYQRLLKEFKEQECEKNEPAIKYMEKFLDRLTHNAI